MKIPPLKVTFSRSDRREILRRIDAALSSGYVVMGRNVEDLEQELGLLYAQMGTKGLAAVPDIGPRLAGEIEQILTTLQAN